MIVQFSKIDFTEKPVLVLRNADGTAIQVLGYAYNLNAEIRYGVFKFKSKRIYKRSKARRYMNTRICARFDDWCYL